MRRLELEVEVGGEYTPFGVAPNRRLEFSLEHSAGWMGSDFDFTTIGGPITRPVGRRYRETLPLTPHDQPDCWAASQARHRWVCWPL